MQQLASTYNSEGEDIPEVPDDSLCLDVMKRLRLRVLVGATSERGYWTTQSIVLVGRPGEQSSI